MTKRTGIITVVIGFLAYFLFTAYTLITPWDQHRTLAAIGDSIGGFINPFISMLGSILVFLALRAQIQANDILHNEIQEDRANRTIQKLSEDSNKAVDILHKSLATYQVQSIQSRHKSYKGREGFWHLFQMLLEENLNSHEIQHFQNYEQELFELMLDLERSLNRFEKTAILKKIPTRFQTLMEQEVEDISIFFWRESRVIFRTYFAYPFTDSWAKRSEGKLDLELFNIFQRLSTRFEHNLPSNLKPSIYNDLSCRKH